KGNSRICKFACAAHNFKYDNNFANLKLITQIISDSKMRKTIGSNPGAIKDACKENGLNEGHCTFFAKSFQLIDRFMSTLENNKENENQISKIINFDENNKKEIIKRFINII
ncbi:hypothetical protein Mgra_00009385, partial [Meloidogyne graminicola]